MTPRVRYPAAFTRALARWSGVFECWDVSMADRLSPARASCNNGRCLDRLRGFEWDSSPLEGRGLWWNGGGYPGYGLPSA